jgi:hypothetical protein
MKAGSIPHRKLNVCEAASYLALSKKTLEKYRSIGGGPAYLKLGAKVVYDIRDLDEWANSHRRISTSKPAERHRPASLA